MNGRLTLEVLRFAPTRHSARGYFDDLQQWVPPAWAPLEDEKDPLAASQKLPHCASKPPDQLFLGSSLQDRKTGNVERGFQLPLASASQAYSDVIEYVPRPVAACEVTIAMIVAS